MDETRKRFTRYSEFKLITQLHQKTREKNVFIMTQERAYQYELDVDIDLLVIDEFYKMHLEEFEERAILLNAVFYKLNKISRQFYLLGPNIKSIPNKLSETLVCSFISSNFITVVSNKFLVSDGPPIEERVVNICNEVEGQTLIYCSSPGRIKNLTVKLLAGGIKSKPQEIDRFLEWLDREYPRDWIFIQALKNGIGIHHGRIPRAISQYVVWLFNKGYIKYLICTSTLIEGVNTTAKNVIIYDNKLARKNLDYFTFNNIVGRSGRMFQYYIGNVYIFSPPPQEDLPFVDLPAFTQPENTPPELLMMLDYNDLNDRSKERISEFKNQNYLLENIIKSNLPVTIEGQIKFARFLHETPVEETQYLRWRGMPNWAQLRGICDHIYSDLKLKQKRTGIFSSLQLATLINKLKYTIDINEWVESDTYELSIDDKIDKVLNFFKSVATFHFPKHLMVLHNIQDYVFRELKVEPGNYKVYANQVESLFLPFPIVLLEEFGLPIQVGMKLKHLFTDSGDIDQALNMLKDINTSDMSLDPFETEIFKHFIDSI